MKGFQKFLDLCFDLAPLTSNSAKDDLNRLFS